MNVSLRAGGVNAQRAPRDPIFKTSLAEIMDDTWLYKPDALRPGVESYSGGVFDSLMKKSAEDMPELRVRFTKANGMYTVGRTHWAESNNPTRRGNPPWLPNGGARAGPCACPYR